MSAPDLTAPDLAALLRHLRVEEFYARYTECLDQERFEDWPDFFVEDCLYKIVPRINHARGLPLATWLSEGRGYLLDRITGIRRTSVYGPRYIRRMVSGIRVVAQQGDALTVRSNFAVFETLPDEFTRVFSVGESHDRIVITAAGLLFREKICVFDSELVPNSLIYPF